MQRVRETSFDHISHHHHLSGVVPIMCGFSGWLQTAPQTDDDPPRVLLRSTANTPPLFQTDVNSSMSKISPAHPFVLLSSSLLTCLGFVRERKDHFRPIQEVKFVCGAPSERKHSLPPHACVSSGDLWRLISHEIYARSTLGSRTSFPQFSHGGRPSLCVSFFPALPLLSLMIVHRLRVR